MLTRPARLAALILCITAVGGLVTPSLADPRPLGTAAPPGLDEPTAPPPGNAAGKKVKTEVEKSGDDKAKAKPSGDKPASDRDERPGASTTSGTATPSSTANPSRDR